MISSDSHEVASFLVSHPQVDMVSFSGSNTTGQEIMRLASSTTKKLILELGGKSPNIVFADCDFEAAVGGTLSAIFMNQGQMCTACSRLLLEDKIYDKFLEAIVDKTRKLKIGPALSYETDVGPLISHQQQAKMLQYVEKGKNEKAKLICGGRIPNQEPLRQGFYFEPTIFADVKNSMTIAQEEIFGPVLSVMRFSSVEEAIGIANDTRFGLAACLWTKDLNKANSVAKHLRCGTVWVNTYGGFFNEASFGGFKQSGFGRELGGEGILEYLQSKHVCFDASPSGRSLVTSWF
jgi:acyl-CoA reductase-like NAD-dependent aldehyde dehydrogenase